MIITEAVDFFVYSLNTIWWAIGRIYIPGTNINGQFLFIFTLILTLGWKIVLAKTLPPMKVDNVEIENNPKKEEKYDKISRKKRK